MAEKGGFAAFKNYVPPPEEVDASNLEFVDTRPPSTKTPISFLQELCVKKQVTPIYELLASEGRVHEPTFLYRVIVSDLAEVGQGKSKKEAKHVAAKRLLEKIVANDLYKDWLLPGETKEEALNYLHSVIPEIGDSKMSKSFKPEQTVVNGTHSAGAVDVSIDLANTSFDDDAGGNPIGRLQEMCLARRWPPPRYELTEESGMPHEKTFTITCFLGKFEQSKSGKSKKLAKRTAAEMMLKFLNELPMHKQDEELFVDEDNQEDDAYGNAEAPNVELDSQLTQLGAQWGFGLGGCVLEDDNEEIPPPRMVELAEMDLASKPPSAELKKLLDDIGQEENWPVSYNFMPRKGKNGTGDYQCLVNFANTCVCHGMGPTRDEAMYSAAKEALEYLKIVSQP